MPANRFNGYTDYGVGIGLRVPHYDHILSKKPIVDWFEIISENYMVDGGRPLRILDQTLDQYRVVQHGVSMYFGSAQPLNRDHLRRIKELTKRTKTPWLSDHLCWGSVDGRYTHDLLPLPYTFEAIRTTAERVCMVQDYLEIPVAVENVSSYAEYHDSEMTEWEFLSEVVHAADCGILLDVNNIYVSSRITISTQWSTSTASRRNVLPRSISPATRSSRSTSSTRTITRSSILSGSSTSAPLSVAVQPPHCLSGMIISPLLKRCMLRRSRPTAFFSRESPLSAGIYAGQGGVPMTLLELQRRMAEDVRRPLTADYEMQKTAKMVDRQRRSRRATLHQTRASPLSSAWRSTTVSTGSASSRRFPRISQPSMLYWGRSGSTR